MHKGDVSYRRSSVGSIALALAWILLLPQVATASIVVSNYMESSVATVSAGPELYSYTSHQTASFSNLAEFDLGTYVDTQVDATGEVLELVSPVATSGWWDTAWGARRCFEVTNPSATTLTEHQVRVEFDSTGDVLAGLVQADGADYRAIASDNTTVLDFWLESGPDTSDTTFWVQLDLPGTNTTSFCLYFGNATATSVSSNADVFSYDVPRQIYYPLYWNFNGGATNNGTLDVVSFVDNNSITVDGVNQVRNAGQVATFTNVNADSVITVTGPISGRGRGGGMDAIVPVSFAGTDMVFPTNRSIQRWTMVSPSGQPANVTIRNGAAVQWTGTVDGTVMVVDADVSGGRAGIITSDAPIIVTHAASNNSQSDSMVVAPFFPGDDIYGVRSRNSNYGFADPGTIDVYRSDGTFQIITGGANAVVTISDSQDLDGNGTAVRLTNMSVVAGGAQQADRDGFESTAYLPERLLESEYYLPSNADYVAFACPTTMNIDVGGTQVPCGQLLPDSPGHGIIGSTPQGTRITSDTGEPFFAYYEDSRNDDETNLFGMKSAQTQAPVPLVVTPDALEVLPVGPTSGTWTSPVIDTTTTDSNVFGLIEMLGDIPANTSVSLQFARGETPALAAIAPFTGPDGTTATSFGAGLAPAPFAWDFAAPFVIARITLATTVPGDSPTVDALSLDYDLAKISQASVHLVQTAAAGDTQWVARAWTEDPALSGGTARAFYLSSSSVLPTAQVQLALKNEVQIEIVGAVLVQTTGLPVTIGPDMPHHVTVMTTDASGSAITVVWQAVLAGTSILIPHTLNITFA